MSKISIKGLDKAALLAALYNASQPQGMGFLHYDPTPMTIEEAKRLLVHYTSFDYLKGRIMKIDLASDEMYVGAYDRDNGQGAAQRVIDSLIATADPANEQILQTHAENTVVQAVKVQESLKEATSIVENDNMLVINLGLSDMEEYLTPKIGKYLPKDESK